MCLATLRVFTIESAGKINRSNQARRNLSNFELEVDIFYENGRTLNQSSSALKTLLVNNSTPAFTNFVLAACSVSASLPTELMACRVTP